MSRAQLIVFMALVLGAGLLVLVNLIEVDLADFRVQQAFVAGLVVATGWLITFLLREASVLLDVRERRRDMIRAVRAEVDLIQYFADKIDWEKAIDDAHAAHDTDPDYLPFIAYGRQFSVLRRLVQEIEILDTERQIRAVIDMFQLLDELDQLEGNFSSEAFRTLPTPRRQEAVVRYLKMQKKLPAVAERMLTQLPNHGG